MPPPAAPPKKEDDEPLHPAAIAGIIVGGLFGFICLIVLLAMTGWFPTLTAVVANIPGLNMLPGIAKASASTGSGLTTATNATLNTPITVSLGMLKMNAYDSVKAYNSR